MKASEVITTLTKLVEEHGNLEVVYDGWESIGQISFLEHVRSIPGEPHSDDPRFTID